MYEGVDTVVLHDELAWEESLPVAFRPLAAAPEPSRLALLHERNLRVLQVCSAIEEQGAIENPDEAGLQSADILRIEAKLNLLLDLMGQLLAAQNPRPPAVLLRFNALGARWRSAAPPQKGAQGLLEIWLRDSLPQPLTLVTHITTVAADGSITASFAPPGDAIADLIEKLAFRRHRRQVAGSRQPRR
jgi:hypothetical protein